MYLFHAIFYDAVCETKEEMQNKKRNDFLRLNWSERESKGYITRDVSSRSSVIEILCSDTSLQNLCNETLSMDVVVERFGLRLTQKDLHTLTDLNWLNDEVINFYMNLLIARGTSSNISYPKVHAMSTFFYPKLLSGGHSSLKRWTKKVDIFAQDLVVVPVHLNIHWCVAIIDFRDKTIVYYDSMGGDNLTCLAALKQYLQDESLDKKQQPYNMSDWELRSAMNIPQQTNGSDCGVFSCMFAEYVCANREITFTQDDMPYFRNRMLYEIINGNIV